MTRREINDRLVEWIGKRARDFGGEIALVLAYGSYVNGSDGERSDVDVYFIPKSERGYAFARTFILAGVGYDIYPRSWSNLESIAALHDTLTPCLADVQVLYSDSNTELARFGVLQERLRRNLGDAGYMRKIAAERFGRACECDGDGYMLMALSDTVAALSGEYFRYGLKRQYEELRGFAAAPAGFAEGYLAVIRGEIPCGELLELVAAHAGFSVNLQPRERKIEPAADLSALAGLYEEICSTFLKIYSSCESGNYALAYLAAWCLQGELDDAAAAFGIERLELAGAFRYDQLEAFAAHTADIERRLVDIIERGGGWIHSFADFDAFAAGQSVRSLT